MASKWFTEQLSNRNFLSPVGFKMNLDIFDGVDFFCQSVNVPDVSVGNTEVSTRYRGIPIASAGGVRYGDLRIKFIIDEDLKNYLTIHDWIIKNNLAEELDTQPFPDYSEGQLEILNSNYNTNIIVKYEGLFPVDLSDLVFDVGDRDIDFLTASATFKFTRYTYITNPNNF